MSDKGFWKQEDKVEAGDVFYASWGYEQTNIDFVEVIKVSPTGKTAICKMAREVKANIEAGAMAEYVIPGSAYGPEFRLQVRQREKTESSPAYKYLVGTYPLIHHDGSSEPFRADSFYKWNGKPLFQSHYH